ncbi:hypothetical protein BH10PSE19_BH10PSE19_17490 [soil metagenome]
MVISPNEINNPLNTVIIAPMTTKGWHYPTRVPISFARKSGFIVLDQLRAIDKSRLVKSLGKLSELESGRTIAVLQAMFTL